MLQEVFHSAHMSRDAKFRYKSYARVFKVTSKKHFCFSHTTYFVFHTILHFTASDIFLDSKFFEQRRG